MLGFGNGIVTNLGARLNELARSRYQSLAISAIDRVELFHALAVRAGEQVKSPA